MVVDKLHRRVKNRITQFFGKQMRLYGLISCSLLIPVLAARNGARLRANLAKSGLGTRVMEANSLQAGTSVRFLKGMKKRAGTSFRFLKGKKKSDDDDSDDDDDDNDDDDNDDDNDDDDSC
ncbi:uncharacterized protein PHALS_10715 [Plasmopara halstedii]|uniref:Uncharacterized protein n=1 Tax=Plasmopara halstedii TaxID=4781 RepID=A0A0P1AIF1_PLAHL|nr:uncharacterized protein PHALS_10715 [Plasmopara halstedii]CEG40521.1 hypothetical protein PHALS_10715 [Plasmopara halstedii]|eukprot:XP_024576890.1 hypothetical protein PHALS_10715 [Plasmopara halstedii]